MSDDPHTRPQQRFAEMVGRATRAANPFGRRHDGQGQIHQRPCQGNDRDPHGPTRHFRSLCGVLNQNGILIEIGTPAGA